MSRIEELIAELAPDGVQHVPTDRLFHLKNGYTPSKSNAAFWSGGTVPWFRMEDIRVNGGLLSSALQQIPDIAVKGGKLFPSNSLLVATSATIGEHALITVPHLSNQRFTSLALRAEYAGEVDMKFFYYYGFVLDEWCRNNTTTSSFSSVDMSGFRKFKFPVPPLEIQREIVRILDQFTQLEAELEAELEARRQQYAFYRDQLLAFPEAGEVRRVSMGDAGSFFGGLNGKSKADFTDGNARFVSYINVFNNIAVDLTRDDFVRVDPGERQRTLTRGDIIFTGSSETPDEVGMSSVVTQDLAEPTYLNSFSIGFRLDDPDLLDPEFAKHLFRSTGMRQQIIKTASGVTRFNVSKARLGKVEFPVPSKDEQARIAGVLDDFEALVNSLSEGLPAELAARRQQYEYYRDKLLTFEEAAA
ncbi:restriction endonuclease subunit S [Microbacterium esteraromaticum]|nr:restriction endonuclease subunit S [Microbacterium esteraromaticum]